MDFGGEVRFGLMLFPGTDQPCNNGAECTAGAVFVDPGPGTADEINMFLGGADTCSFGTPIAENLDSLVDYAGLEDTMRPNYILLVTDGMATCEDPVPSGSVLSCEFVLDEVPPDLEDLYAFLDMMLVDRDPTHMSGWDYDPDTNRVIFYGPACDAIQSGEVEQVSIVFGCPELPPPAG